MKQTLSSSSVSKVRSDIILSVPIASLVSFPQLHIINEENERSTFNNTRGVSNIDLTVVNISLLTDVHDWEISEEDSLSDHSYLKYKISTSRGKPYKNKTKYRSAKYVIKEEKLVILQALSTRNDKKDQHDKQRSRSR